MKPSSPSRPEVMRAAVLYGKEDVRLEQVPVPEIGPGEILLKIEAALTCGTDVKVFRRGYHAAMIRPPSVFGHELAGTVAEAQPRADGTIPFPVGARVVVANSTPCGRCYFCSRGQENLCAELAFLNGAYAQYIRVPARFVEVNTCLIPDRVSFAGAALTEPLACVVQGIEQTAPRAGDTVLVLGLGPIGLMFVAMLKGMGVRVIGVGRQPARLQVARELKADAVIEADADGAWNDRLHRGPPLDAVIEATGRPEVWERAFALVRKGGVVNLFGGCPAGTNVRIDTTRMHYDQITLKSTFHHRPSDIRAALAAIESGVLPARRFITAERPLEELPAVLRSMLTSNAQIKYLIRPG